MKDNEANRGPDDRQEQRRRRGAELERALLQAAWDELKAVGYSNFTMEAVAGRAGTSKPVIYRRWPSRATLVLAALRQQSFSIADDVPDTGDLRKDTLAVLHHLRDRQEVFGAEVVHGLLAELRDVPPGVFEILPNVMMAVLAHAVARGEARRDRLTTRVAALPGNLVRHEMMIGRGPITDDFLREIVDEVFLPLVATSRYLGSQQARLDSARRPRLTSSPTTGNAGT